MDRASRLLHPGLGGVTKSAQAAAPKLRRDRARKQRFPPAMAHLRAGQREPRALAALVLDDDEGRRPRPVASSPWPPRSCRRSAPDRAPGDHRSAPACVSFSYIAHFVEVRVHFSDQDRFHAIRPDDVEWKAFAAFPPEARLAVLVGDPAKPGPYVTQINRNRTLGDELLRSRRGPSKPRQLGSQLSPRDKGSN